MTLLPFVASTMYIIFKERQIFYREQYNKTCSMLIVGMIKVEIPIWTKKNKLDNKFSLVPYMYNFKRTYQVSSVNGKKNEGKTCPNMCHESSSVPTRTIYIDSSLKKDCPYQPQSSQKRKTTLGMFDLKRQ